MISHAKDSFESYQTSAHDADSTMAHAFEHHMAAELLKTPSPKKKRAVVSKFASMHAKNRVTVSSDPFSDEKENRPASSDSPTYGSQPSERVDAKTEPRNTRSRGDKSQLVQLPNPFQSRVLQAKDNAKHSKSTKSAGKAADAKRADSKKKTESIVNDGMAEKPSNHLSKATEPLPPQRQQGEQQSRRVNADDDSREVEYSLQVAPDAEARKETQEVVHSEKPAKVDPTPARQASKDTSTRASTEYVSASVGHEADNAEVGEIEAVSMMDEMHHPVFDSPSPRESTPPPKSPTKQERAEMSMRARDRLEKSLMKLVSDDEGSEREDDHAILLQNGPASSSTTAPSNLYAPKVKETDKPGTHFAPPADLARQVSQDELVAEQPLPQASAPKRTLSSMAHAKKSIVGSSSTSNQRGRGSSMAPSAAATKGSFLSKSIMRVEQDRKSSDDALETMNANADVVTSSLHDPSSKKRKSDEVADEGAQAAERGHLAKSVKQAPGESANKPAQLSDREKQPVKTAGEEKNVASHAHPQSLREKIESYNTNRNTAAAPSSGPSRNFSSMSTHSVGLGAAKISSPIFSRSNSQNTLVAEPVSPSRESKGKKSSPSASRLKSKDDAGANRRATAVEPTTSTTPLNSPGPTAMTLYPGTANMRGPTPGPSSAPVHSGKSRESIDEGSESDVGAYDTSSDGDLSLVDLMGNVKVNPALKANALAPRPPGTSLRPISAIPKGNHAQPNVPNKGNSFMPSTATNKDGRPASRLGRGDDQHQGSSASTVSGSSAASSTAASVAGHHASWGGSISSKLKGILGFSTNGTVHPPIPATPTSVSAKSASTTKTQAPITIPARKESFIGANNNTGRINGSGAAQASAASADKRPASVIRADMVRKKETEQAERRAREKEERSKVISDANKKRARDEAAAPTSASAAKMKPAHVGPATGKAVKHQASQQRMATAANAAQSDAKKRKSNDGVTVSVTRNTAGPSSSAKPAATQVHKPASSAASHAKPVSNATSKVQTQPKHGDAPQAVVFSDHNPFQRAQQQQQQQSLAAISQQVQRHKAGNLAAHQSSTAVLSPASKAKVAATEHIELEEPDSAYSDSEDEETIRRRQQHKPWETREGLAMALEAQASVDADLIFGIPQGAVPLDDILPAETEHARVRRMRPRSSSATWSRDGLQQFEIDRYNERMGIKGPGVLLGGLSRDDGSGTPSRAGRMSALAQSAIAQGQVSNKKGHNYAHR